MLGAEDGGDRCGALVGRSVLGGVQGEGGGGDHAVRLPRDDGQGGERTALVVAFHLVADGFLGPSRPREQRMQRPDGLVRAAQPRRPDGLGQQLPAEEAVVAQSLVPGLVARAARGRAQIEAGEQVAPEFTRDKGHASESKGDFPA